MSDTTLRNTELRHMLIERRDLLLADVKDRIRGGRTAKTNDVRDDIELSDASNQGDIEFALLQMRTETLTRIEKALSRLDEGTYGSCFECNREIAERRLRALPFAARCQECEERRETIHNRARQLAQRRGGFSLVSDVPGS